MAFINGISNTHNTDQFHTEVVTLSKNKNALLKLIADNGIKSTTKDMHKWSVINFNEIGNTSRDNLEFQKAPDGFVFTGSEEKNRTEIFHEAFGVSYEQNTRDKDEYNSAVNLSLTESGVKRLVNNQIAKSVVSGTMVDSTSLAVASKMDGLLNIIGNVKDVSTEADRVLTRILVEDAMQAVYDNGEFGETIVFVMNAKTKRKWNSVFPVQMKPEDIQNRKFAQLTNAYESDFGIGYTLIDQNLPDGHIMILSADALHLVFKDIVRYDEARNAEYGGFMFIEKLAKEGNYDKWQLYASLTLEFGSKFNHALLKGFTI